MNHWSFRCAEVARNWAASLSRFYSEAPDRPVLWAIVVALAFLAWLGFTGQ